MPKKKSTGATSASLRKIAKAAADGAGSSSLVVASKVKAMVAEAGMRSESGFTDALSAEVRSIVTRAIARAQAHGKATLRGADL